MPNTTGSGCNWHWLLARWEVTWSTTNETLYGMSPGQFDGRMETILNCIHPDDRETIGTAIAQSDASTGRETRQYRVVWPDGSIHWLESTGQSLCDAEGRALNRIGVTSDITERKLAEEKLLVEQSLLRQLIEAHELEQRVIAYDLHDGPVQYAAAAKMHLEAAAHKIGEAPGHEKLTRVAMLLYKIVEEGRRLMNGIRPPALDEMGIAAAIEDLIHVNQWALERATFHSTLGKQRFEPVVELTLYRIAQESLTNAEKHSQAGKIDVDLRYVNERLCLEVRDDGIGFVRRVDKSAIHGLRGIEERVRLLSGTCRIESRPGKGTRIYVELPAVQRVKERKDEG
jgi:PAS domain S-box-containing protein